MIFPRTKITLACGTAAMAVVLCSCGSSAKPAATVVPTTAPSAVSSVAVAAKDSRPTPTPTAKPIAYYAAEFEKISAPATKIQAELKALPDDASDADVQALATKLVTELQAEHAKMLRTSWPANVTADIRAMIIADGPILGDYADLSASAGRAATDSGPANAAANIVAADLGLPPVS